MKSALACCARSPGSIIDDREPLITPVDNTALANKDKLSW